MNSTRTAPTEPFAHIARSMHATRRIITATRTLGISADETACLLRGLADIVEAGCASPSDAESQLDSDDNPGVTLEVPTDDDGVTALDEALQTIEAALAQVSESHADAADILARLSTWHARGGLSRLGDALPVPSASDVLTTELPTPASPVADTNILDRLRQAGLWIKPLPDGQYAIAIKDDEGMRTCQSPDPQSAGSFFHHLIRWLSLPNDPDALHELAQREVADPLPERSAAADLARFIIARGGSAPRAIDDALAYGYTDTMIQSAFLALARHALGN